MNIVISNASPLIGLSSINCLHILKELWNEIIIPEAVYNEVVVNASGKPNVLNGFWIDDGLIEEIKKDISEKF